MSLWAALLVAGAASFTHAGVRESIDAVLADPYLNRVQAGVKVVRLGATPQENVTLYERSARTPLIPASNLKLITTAAALEGLGRDFQFRTLLVQNGNRLAIVGDGDPTLGDAELLKKVGWQSTTLFKTWADALASRGGPVRDQVLFDDSIFDDQFVHPNWPGDQIHKRYVAGVAGLNFNANCLDFYLKPKGAGAIVDYVVDPAADYAPIENNCVLGSRNAVWLSRAAGSSTIILRGQTNGANVEPISVTVDNPPLLAATVLRSELTKAGVVKAPRPTRDPNIRAAITPAGEWQVLAVHETPIAQVLGRANKDSMNLYAEALCKRLGAARTPTEPGSWKTGTAALGAYLRSIGVPADEFSLDDGCGLSRRNTLSPNAIVQVLSHEHFSGGRETFISSLAIAGVDGTLKDRFDTFPGLQQRVFGKSGFIDGVSSLSGYLRSRDGQTTYAFSIMFNGIAKGTNSTAKRLQERIVAAIEQ